MLQRGRETLDPPSGQDQGERPGGRLSQAWGNVQIRPLLHRETEDKCVALRVYHRYHGGSTDIGLKMQHKSHAKKHVPIVTEAMERFVMQGSRI